MPSDADESSSSEDESENESGHIEDIVSKKGLGSESDEEAAESNAHNESPKKKQKLTKWQSNIRAVDAKLKEISLPSEWSWRETLSLTTMEPLALQTSNDDFARESAFYKATLECVMRGVKQLDEHNIPYERPNDFYVEMVKSDKHMAQVKAKILHSKKRIEIVEARRTQKTRRKYGKAAKANAQRERARQKNSATKVLNAWKKSTDKSNKSLSSALEGKLINALDSKRGAPKRNKKRERKNEKYGFGGKKRGQKRNDKESAWDIQASYKSKINSPANRHLLEKLGKRNKNTGAKSRSKGKRAKGKRPGKRRRQQRRG